MAKKKPARARAKKKGVGKKAVVDVPPLRCPVTGALAPAGSRGH